MSITEDYDYDDEEVLADHPDHMVKCPHCGAQWQDVHEYFDACGVDEVATDCIECGKPMKIRAAYEVTYYTRKGKSGEST